MRLAFLGLLLAACSSVESPDAGMDGGVAQQVDLGFDAGAEPDLGASSDLGSTDVLGASDLGQDAGARQEIRVLFVGNSYTNAHNMPAVLAAMSEAEASPVRFVTSKHTVGGQTFEGHNFDPEVAARINEGWDFVVLQDQSSQPFRMLGVKQALIDLDQKIRDSGAQTVLFMTWAFDQDGPAGMRGHAQVNQYYVQGAEHIGGRAAPVGRAWERGLRAGFRLHANDGSHPNPLGSYLAACVFYTTISGASSVGLGTAGLSIDPADAAALQRISDETIEARRSFEAPRLGRWSLSATGDAQELIPSDDFQLGTLPGPDGEAQTGTRFSGSSYALAPYLPKMAPASLTVSFQAHREDWSAPEPIFEWLLELPGHYAVIQRGSALQVAIVSDGVRTEPVEAPVDGLSPGWHHVVFSHSQAGTALWIDEMLVSSSTVGGALGQSEAPLGLLFGISSSVLTSLREAGQFSGGLSQVELFEGAFTPDALRAL